MSPSGQSRGWSGAALPQAPRWEELVGGGCGDADGPRLWFRCDQLLEEEGVWQHEDAGINGRGGGAYHRLAIIAAIGDRQVLEVQTKRITFGFPAAISASDCFVPMPPGALEHFTAVRVAQTAPTARIAHLGRRIAILRVAARRGGALGGCGGAGSLGSVLKEQRSLKKFVAFKIRILDLRTKLILGGKHAKVVGIGAVPKIFGTVHTHLYFS